MQIEGPSVSVRFEISSLGVVAKMARFLARHSAKTKRPSNGSAKRDDSLVLGGNDRVTVSLVKDDEYDDRLFFVIGPAKGLMVRLVIAGEEVSEIVGASRQVKQDLDDDARP